MNVLYLITSLGSSGGSERGLVAMAAPLVARGIKLQVAYLREKTPSLAGQLAEAGIELVSLAGGSGPPGRVQRATRLVRERRPDVLHTTLTEANLVGRAAGGLTGTPVVSTLVTVSYGPEQRSAPGARPAQDRLVQVLDVASARRVARFHAVTRWVADVMAPRLRVARDRIDVVPRGRDPNLLGRRSLDRRTRVRRELGVGQETPLLLTAARHEHAKGLDVLVEAMPMLRAARPDVQLVVAGRSGESTFALETAIARLGVEGSVRFLGVRNDVPDLLCAADAYVLPSRWEGIAGVLLEAMAMEAPIVASDIPPVREVVGGERHAVLVAPTRPEALAAAIVATLDDAGGALERAARARRRFLEHFTIDRVADQMAAFYERTLARPDAGRPGRSSR